MLPFSRSCIPLAALILGLGAGESRAVLIDLSGTGHRSDLDSRSVSNPYRYEFAHLDNVWQDPEGSWHHAYSIKNQYSISKPPSAPTVEPVHRDHHGRTRSKDPIRVHTPAAIPEPGTGALLATGLAALVFAARRRRSPS